MTDIADHLAAVELPNGVARAEVGKKGGCMLCGAELEVSVIDLCDTRLGSPGTYEIRRCVECGLEQTFPTPSVSELKDLYETYYNFGGETGTRYTRWRERFLFSFLYRVWTWLDGDVAFHSRRGTGRLLDIGCNVEREGMLCQASYVVVFEHARQELQRECCRLLTFWGSKCQSIRAYEYQYLRQKTENATELFAHPAT